MGPGGGPGPLPMLQRLDLTDAQKEQVKGILSERSGHNAGQTLGRLHQDLTAAVMADVPDTAKIEQLKASINEAEAAALNERVDLQLRIAQILTPEQRLKAREAPAGPRGRAAF
jgi:Spy/CpxP family protein refolding chaperone